MAIPLIKIDPDADHPEVQAIALESRPQGGHILGFAVQNGADIEQVQVTVLGETAHLGMLAYMICQAVLGGFHPLTQEVGETMVKSSDSSEME